MHAVFRTLVPGIAALVALLVVRPAVAEPGCGEQAARALMSQLPGFRLVGASAANPGVRVLYEGDGRPDKLAAALFLVDGNLHTFQMLVDAEGRSIEEDKALGDLDGLYEKMSADPSVLGCDEFKAAGAPESVATYDALKELMGFSSPSGSADRKGFGAWLGWITTIVFFGGLVAVFAYSFLRRRKSRDQPPPAPSSPGGDNPPT